MDRYSIHQGHRFLCKELDENGKWVRFKDMEGLIALNNKLTDMLHDSERMILLAWEAVQEAGYEGYSNKLNDYMEHVDE